jgi:hypothetical protein
MSGGSAADQSIASRKQTDHCQTEGKRFGTTTVASYRSKKDGFHIFT